MARGARPILYGPRAGLNIGTWPGQPGNPVGFAATPASPPPGWTFGGTWPGAWPGSFTGGGPTTTSAFGGFTSGTAGNPHVYSFIDFDAGSGTNFPSANGLSGGGAVQYINFVGCRFQSNNQTGNQVNTNILSCSSTNLNFFYCSFTPRTAVATSPPSGAWPSASVGTGITIAGAITQYMLSGTGSYQYATWPLGPSTFDHCDFWGYGQTPTNLNNGDSNVNMIDCWVHDACNPSPNGYHTDGGGYQNGLAAPTNLIVRHCTIASLGNTEAIAYQTASSPYSFISVTNNYLSGFSDVVTMCYGSGNLFVTGSNNLTFTDNIIATDLAFTHATYTELNGLAAAWNGTGNIWRRNKLKVYPGDTWSGFNANDGQFVLPGDGTGAGGGNYFSVTDWAG